MFYALIEFSVAGILHFTQFKLDGLLIYVNRKKVIMSKNKYNKKSVWFNKYKRNWSCKFLYLRKLSQIDYFLLPFKVVQTKKSFPEECIANVSLFALRTKRILTPYRRN